MTLSTHKKNLNSPTMSVNHLNSALQENAALMKMPNSEWQCISSDKAKGNTDTNLYGDLVIVGQAISVDAIQILVDTEFTGFDCVIIKAHPLHLVYNSQAIVIRIFHHEITRLLDIKNIKLLAKRYYFDCFKPSKIKLSQPGLLVMDMDSTIIDMECIDEIAHITGLGEKVSVLTERAMQGELDFNQSLEARVSCLQGVELESLNSIKSRLPINPGFASTIACLQARGWITCIASGGFTYFADYLKDTFDLDEAISNTLGIIDNTLSGKVEGQIINAEMKREVLQDMLRKYNIDPQQSIAIGDGANDLLMMDCAELGVAYKAKPKVQDAADANIYYCGFEGLLYCLQS